MKFRILIGLSLIIFFNNAYCSYLATEQEKEKAISQAILKLPQHMLILQDGLSSALHDLYPLGNADDTDDFCEKAQSMRELLNYTSEALSSIKSDINLFNSRIGTEKKEEKLSTLCKSLKDCFVYMENNVKDMQKKLDIKPYKIENLRIALIRDLQHSLFNVIALQNGLRKILDGDSLSNISEQYSKERELLHGFRDKYKSFVLFINENKHSIPSTMVETLWKNKKFMHDLGDLAKTALIILIEEQQFIEVLSKSLDKNKYKKLILYLLKQPSLRKALQNLNTDDKEFQRLTLNIIQKKSSWKELMPLLINQNAVKNLIQELDTENEEFKAIIRELSQGVFTEIIINNLITKALAKIITHSYVTSFITSKIKELLQKDKEKKSSVQSVIIKKQHSFISYLQLMSSILYRYTNPLSSEVNPFDNRYFFIGFSERDKKFFDVPDFQTKNADDGRRGYWEAFYRDWVPSSSQHDSESTKQFLKYIECQRDNVQKEIDHLQRDKGKEKVEEGEEITQEEERPVAKRSLLQRFMNKIFGSEETPYTNQIGKKINDAQKDLTVKKEKKEQALNFLNNLINAIRHPDQLILTENDIEFFVNAYASTLFKNSKKDTLYLQETKNQLRAFAKTHNARIEIPLLITHVLNKQDYIQGFLSFEEDIVPDVVKIFALWIRAKINKKAERNQSRIQQNEQQAKEAEAEAQRWQNTIDEYTIKLTKYDYSIPKAKSWFSLTTMFNVIRSWWKSWRYGKIISRYQTQTSTAQTAKQAAETRARNSKQICEEIIRKPVTQLFGLLYQMKDNDSFDIMRIQYFNEFTQKRDFHLAKIFAQHVDSLFEYCIHPDLRSPIQKNNANNDAQYSDSQIVDEGENSSNTGNPAAGVGAPEQ